MSHTTSPDDGQAPTRPDDGPESAQPTDASHEATEGFKTKAFTSLIGGLPSADVVKRNLLEKMNASDAHVSAVLWLLEQGRLRQLSQNKLAKLVGLDTGALSKVFRGEYPAGLDAIASRIDAERRLLLQRETSTDKPIAETWVLQECGKFCDAVRADQSLGILTGRSHTGKSVALQTYQQRNNHGRTIYVKMPPGGSPRMFLIALARACSISDRNAYDQLRDRMIRFFDTGMLLVIDEMHQTVVGRKLQTVTLECIRDLYDASGCGMVLCATKVFTDKMKEERHRLFFEQIDNRGILRRRLPDLAPWMDIRAIVGAYGLPPAPREKLHPGDKLSPHEFLVEIRKTSGIGKLANLLRTSRRIATKRGELFSWRHVLDVELTRQSWESGDGPEDDQEHDREEGK